jgi:hypothetical protein
MTIDILTHRPLRQVDSIGFRSIFLGQKLTAPEFHLQTAPSIVLEMEDRIVSMGLARCIRGNQYIGLGLLPSSDFLDYDLSAAADIIFVLDVSGSMSGSRLQAAKIAIGIVLENMPETSLFNVIPFWDSFVPFYPESVPGNAENREDATRKLMALSDQGGTQLLPPLEMVYRSPPREGFGRQLLVVTDGESSNQPEITKLVQSLGTECRISTIGISANGSRPFLEELAAVSGGDAVFVNEGTEIAPHVGRFFEKCSCPAVVDVGVEIVDAPGFSMVPSPVKPLVANCISYLFLRKRDLARDKFDVHLRGSNGLRSVDLHVRDSDSPIHIEKFYGDFWMTDCRLVMKQVTSEIREHVKNAAVEISLGCGVLGPFTELVPQCASRELPQDLPVSNELTHGQAQALADFQAASQKTTDHGPAFTIGGLEMSEVIAELAPVEAEFQRPADVGQPVRNRPQEPIAKRKPLDRSLLAHWERIDRLIFILLWVVAIGFAVVDYNRYGRLLSHLIRHPPRT